ncbi:uncharacterized protein LOC111718231 [Eurytemora carolleeae]|uniref:uncharacterized protein LOC111718231 n=1 Tax=Eurytemora carolleeae TaxID=1294199 RepID=UPI000C78B9F6|nr:uncharacterized protein LOC111718231 [Eurytemora carolleeae]|eukprot:XP_023349541.1 uncharacterized protein LOC111718231 [Eurytemora affinis]
MQKTLFLLSALLVFSTAAEDSCAGCKQMSARLLDNLKANDSIWMQTIIMVKLICPKDSDPSSCEQMSKENWKDLADVFYKILLGQEKACQQTEACNIIEEWTCDKCIESVQHLGANERTNYYEAFTLLQDVIYSYCEDNKTIDNCKKVVTRLTPVGLSLINTTLNSFPPDYLPSENICIDIFIDKIIADPCNDVC